MTLHLSTATTTLASLRAELSAEHKALKLAGAATALPLCAADILQLVFATSQCDSIEDLLKSADGKAFVIKLQDVVTQHSGLTVPSSKKDRMHKLNEFVRQVLDIITSRSDDIGRCTTVPRLDTVVECIQVYMIPEVRAKFPFEFAIIAAYEDIKQAFPA